VLGEDLGADPLEPQGDFLPGTLGAHRIGGDEDEIGTARQRLAETHPGADPVRLGGT
jgi:hypothetical protein